MDNMKNIFPETLDEAKLLKAIFEEEPHVREAKRKACEWLTAHEKMVSVDDIIDSVEVVQMSIADDMQKWDEMKDDEKTDLSLLMCGLMVARDLIADMFGMKTEGRVEKGEAQYV